MNENHSQTYLSILFPFSDSYSKLSYRFEVRFSRKIKYCFTEFKNAVQNVACNKLYVFFTSLMCESTDLDDKSKERGDLGH